MHMKLRRDSLFRRLRTAVSRAGWNRRLLFLIAATLLIEMMLILTAAQFQTLFFRTSFEGFIVGEPAPRDLYADRTVTYVDAEATKARVDAIARLVPPVYVVNSEIGLHNFSLYEDFARIVLSDRNETANAQTLYFELQAELPNVVPREVVADLVEVSNLASVVTEAGRILDQAYRLGVVDSRSGLQSITEVAAHRVDDSGEPVIVITPAEELVAVDDIEEFVRSRLREEDLAAAGIITRVIAPFLQTNAFFHAELTEQSRRQAVGKVEPVVRKIVKGERLIQEGLIVSEEIAERIKALSTVAVSRSSSKIIGTVLLVAAVFVLALILFSQTGSALRLTSEEVLLLLSVSIVYGVSLLLVHRFVELPRHIPTSVLLPSALVAMLLSVLIHPRIALFMALIDSLLVLVATGFEAYGAVFALASGTAGALVVVGAKKRLDLMRAGVLLAVVHVVMFAVVGAFRADSFAEVAAASGWGIIAGFVAGVLNLSLLPFLEHVFNAATPFRLIELSDLNAPVLKRMLTLAPGTYGHSVMVANLSESACREIGADPLLARVGAYYHDIGKIDQAEYFVENQTGANKHDDLKPSLSVAVIKSHVKIGIEKAKELGLPRKVVSIIAQHHGSQLINYFYAQALKDGSAAGINRKDYSYGGTPPVSREAAVVMLADGVEAASRTLKKPSVAKLEKFVWKTILDKFSTGQMSNCELTFRDLDMIKKTFVHILAGQFHSRIEYPEVGDELKRKRGVS